MTFAQYLQNQRRYKAQPKHKTKLFSKHDKQFIALSITLGFLSALALTLAQH